MTTILGSCPPGVHLGGPNTMQPKTGSIIRLMDSSGKKMLDSVLCDYEDSFTLESFDELISCHKLISNNEPKQFIIARVQTWDLSKPERAYYSYYNAFHLNRTLFQTQIYLGKKLIHRMHVLNPLTNTDIIGHVLYFIVSSDNFTSKTQESNIKDFVSAASPTVAAAEAGLPQFWTLGVQAVSIITEEKEYAMLSAAASSSSSSHGSALKSPSDASGQNSAANIRPRSRTSVALSDGARRISAAARLITNKLSIFSPRLEDPRLEENCFEVSKIPKSDFDTSPRRDTMLRLKPSSPGNTTILNHEQLSTVTDLPIGASKVPSEPLIINNISQARVSAPSGIITRFNMPATNSSLSSNNNSFAKHKGLCDKNLTTKSDILTKNTPDIFQSDSNRVSSNGDIFEDAKFDLGGTIESQEEENRKTITPNNKLPEVNNAFTKDTRIRSLTIRGDSTLSKSQNLRRQKVTFSPVEKTIIKYDAVLIATDTDFLESSAVRARFRLNALVPADSHLFELPEFTGRDYDNDPQDESSRESPIVQITTSSSIRRLGRRGNNEPRVLMGDEENIICSVHYPCFYTIFCCFLCFSNLKIKRNSIFAKFLSLMNRIQFKLCFGVICGAAIACIIIMVIKR